MVADSFFLRLAADAEQGGFLPAELHASMGDSSVRVQENLLVALGEVDYEVAPLDLTDKMEQGRTLRGLERAVLSPTLTMG